MNESAMLLADIGAGGQGLDSDKCAQVFLPRMRSISGPEGGNLQNQRRHKVETTSPSPRDESQPQLSEGSTLAMLEI